MYNYFFCVYFLQFPTGFEHPCAHHQENQLFQYDIWYCKELNSWLVQKLEFESLRTNCPSGRRKTFLSFVMECRTTTTTTTTKLALNYYESVTTCKRLTSRLLVKTLKTAQTRLRYFTLAVRNNETSPRLFSGNADTCICNFKTQKGRI
jgi:hypothetical protein